MDLVTEAQLGSREPLSTYANIEVDGQMKVSINCRQMRAIYMNKEVDGQTHRQVDERTHNTWANLVYARLYSNHDTISIHLSILAESLQVVIQSESLVLALFPGLLTVQCLIVCSVQGGGRPGFISSYE